MQRDLESALRKATDFLKKHGLQYALIGGVAVSQWGYDRKTADIDFKVLVPNSDYGAIRSLLRKEFPHSPRELLPENSPVVAVRIDNVIVDYAMCYPGYEELVVERAVERNIKGFVIRVATAEDIIILKAIADRPRDWQDIEGLLRARKNKVDFGYLESWLPQFAEALEKPELLDKYYSVKAQVEGNRKA